MSNILQIQRATEKHAEAIADLLRRSIIELCVSDHHNEMAVLSQWLENKTSENVRRWSASPANILLVASEGDRIRSVGCVTRDGRIVLNYVCPDFRFRGASKAMMEALEGEARTLGLSRLELDSTATARDFYHAIGYLDDGEMIVHRGVAGYPMSKAL